MAQRVPDFRQLRTGLTGGVSISWGGTGRAAFLATLHFLTMLRFLTVARRSTTLAGSHFIVTPTFAGSNDAGAGCQNRAVAVMLFAEVHAWT